MKGAGMEAFCTPDAAVAGVPPAGGKGMPPGWAPVPLGALITRVLHPTVLQVRCGIARLAITVTVRRRVHEHSPPLAGNAGQVPAGPDLAVRYVLRLMVRRIGGRFWCLEATALAAAAAKKVSLPGSLTARPSTTNQY